MESIIVNLIEKRNEKQILFSRLPSNRNCHEYKEARSTLKKAVEKAKEDWLKEKLEEIETMNGTDPRTAWKAIKEFSAGLYGH